MIVDAEGLTRRFTVGRRRSRREVSAVDGIDLRIDAGESVAFLGPNGAGKSTTIKMLTGVLVPTAGRLEVCGLEPVARRRELAARLGVVFGQRSALWWDLPLADSFDLLRAIHGIPPAEFGRRRDRCVELLELAGFLDTPVRQLSLGQRMRGEVTAALLHAPPLLVLDEPTVGLDLVSKERLRGFLRAANADDGITIVLTTHDLPDVERLCRRVVVIDRGRVVADDDLAALRRRAGGPRELVVELAAPSPPPSPQVLPGVLAVLAEADGLRWRVRFDGGTNAAAVVADVMRRAQVRDVTLVEPSIEDLVRTFYAGEAVPPAR